MREGGLLEVRLLGPVAVFLDGSPVELEDAQRALLARLALDVGRTVAAPRLAAELWAGTGEHPADRLGATADGLRRSLGRAAPLITDHGGSYGLGVATSDVAPPAVPRADVDAATFEELTAKAERLRLAGRDPNDVGAVLRHALGLWRGTPLGGIGERPFITPHAARLLDAWLRAVEHRVEVDLALGRHRDLVWELEGLVAEHPLQERLWSQLMVALRRSNSSGDALARYEALRAACVDETDARARRRSVDGRPSAVGAAFTPEPPPAAGATATVAVVRLLPPDPSHGRTGPGSPVWTALDRLVDDTTRAHGGRSGGGTPDTRCVLFASVPDALAAAEAVQRNIATGVSGVDAAVCIHTGPLAEERSTAAGAAVNLALSVALAAHRGQTLVTSAAGDLVAGPRRKRDRLVDLGPWVLPEVPRPQHLFELAQEGRPAFGAPRCGRPGTPPLPEPTTSFVGRDATLDTLRRLMVSRPLVTVVGPRGVGKTRLAVEAARSVSDQMADGAWLCDVRGGRGAADVARRLGGMLGADLGPGREPTSAVIHRLRHASAVVILDNGNELLDAVADVVTAATGSAHDVHFVVTASRPLGLDGEELVAIGPLAATHEGVDVDPACRILVDRAREGGTEVSEEDPSLLRIAESAGRNPAAIELTARRLRWFCPGDLADHLELSLRDARRGGRGPARRDVDAVATWAWNLLAPTEQDLLAALAVCDGGATASTASALGATVGLDARTLPGALASLCDHAMVRTDRVVQHRTRYRVSDHVRGFALAHLADRRRERVEARHSSCFVSLLAEATRIGYGPNEQLWICQIDEEFDNLRAVYRRACSARDWSTIAELLDGLTDELVVRERGEIATWAEELGQLDIPDGDPLAALVLAVQANTHLTGGDLSAAASASRRSLTLARRAGREPPWLATNCLALAFASEGRLHDASAVLRAMDAAPERRHAMLARAVSMFDQALIASFTSRPERGEDDARRLSELAEQLGSPTLQAMALISAARTTRRADAGQPRRDTHRAVELATSVRSPLLVAQARRVAAEAAAAGADGRPGDARVLLDLLGSTADLSQQLQTVLAALGSLVAAEALTAATTVAAGLSQTALGGSQQCRQVLELARRDLSPSVFARSVEEGRRLTAAELVATARLALTSIDPNS